MSTSEWSLGGYPLGASDDPQAPYNRTEELVDVEVTVSVTYSKILKVRVEKGYTNKTLKDAIEEMEILPKNILEKKADEIQEDIDMNDWLFTGSDLQSIKQEIALLRGWHEDELEVIED